MTLATLDHLGAAVGDAFPNYIVSIDLGTHNLLAYVIIQPTDQVHVVTDRGQSGALSRRRHPLRIEGQLHLHPETLALLHPLDVRLQSADQLIDQLVMWDVLRRIDMKLLVFLFVTAFILSITT